MHFKEVTSKYASLHNIAQRKTPTPLSLNLSIFKKIKRFFSTYDFTKILSLFHSILNSFTIYRTKSNPTISDLHRVGGVCIKHEREKGQEFYYIKH